MFTKALTTIFYLDNSGGLDQSDVVTLTLDGADEGTRLEVETVRERTARRGGHHFQAVLKGIVEGR